MNEEKDYATHIVKQSLPKDVREKMSKEELNEMPILGNFKHSGGARADANSNAAPEKTFTPEDDLPF